MARRSQLIEAAISPRSIDHRIATGSLHPEFRGVYSIGHRALAPLALETAALLGAGDDCALSHGSAAAIWGFASSCPIVALTIIARNIRCQPRLTVHRVRGLDVRDVRVHHGLPVTAPARTLIDRAAQISPDQLDRELNEARVLNLVTDADLYAAIDRCPGRTGVGALRALLTAQRGPALTRSEAERRFRHIIEHGQLPWPRFNVYLHHKQVDLLWPDLHLIVEVDGYSTHSTRKAFERDRQRDQHLAAQGYTTIRITWRQLTQHPLAVLSNLAQAIARAQALRGL
jgi:very-short-patch-repair endonuclease